VAANGSFKTLGSPAVSVTYNSDISRLGFFGTSPITKKTFSESGIIDPKLAELAIVLRDYGLINIIP